MHFLDGDYHYTGGINRRAFAALVPAAVIGVVIALVPTFESVAGFSWFFGAAIAAVLYLLIVPRGQRFNDVSGAGISRPGI